MNEEPRQGFKSGVFAGGILLIVFGVIFLLEQLDLAEFGDLASDYWPTIIIFIGVTKLFNRETIGSAIGTLSVGVWLQFVELGLFNFTFRNSWPMVVIGIGAGMALQAIIDSAAGRRRGAV